MDTAIKHRMLGRVKPSFVIFDIWALSVRVPGPGLADDAL